MEIKNNTDKLQSIIFAMALGVCQGLIGFPWSEELLLQVSHVLWILFVSVIGFLILDTNRISRWRSVFFVVLAVFFILHFKASLIGLGKNPFFSSDVQEVPYCHIAMASSFLNYLYQQYLAFQSGSWKLWGPLSLGVLWLAVTLSIGRAWCSWACFYGGIDDGISRVLPKPLVKKYTFNKTLRDLPAAILIFMTLVSLSAMLPIFCLWLCPLKITTAFLDTHSPTRLLQIILFSAIGISTLIVLPLILKKRFFCGLICPFGAWQSFFGRINPFRVAIAPDKCTQCGLCLKSCPTFVLNDDALKNHTISAYCNLCGECIDACPQNAMTYTLLGRPIHLFKSKCLTRLFNAKTFFVFSCLLVGGAVGGLFVPPRIAYFLEVVFKQ